MLSNWKICFNVINIPTYDESMCNLGKLNETVKETTCTNFPVWCHQTTKTTSKCNTNSFGPVWKLRSVTLKCEHVKKPQRSVKQHKLSKVKLNATNRDKHKNEAPNQTFGNNFFKMSFSYAQCMFSNWKICFHVFNIQTSDKS